MLKKYMIIMLLLNCFVVSPITNAQEIDSQYTVDNKSFEQIIAETLGEFGYSSENVAIAYYDFYEDAHYTLNDSTIMLAASASKVGTAALYMQLIDQGRLSLDSLIAYDATLFEAGGGAITNGAIQSTYSVEELIYEMLHNSDNTAWNLLTNYYYQNYGNYQEDLLLFSQADVFSPELYQFNYVTAEVLEGILIQIASSDIYSEVVNILMDSQSNWLMKSYINEDMAAKYGYLDNYYHDIGLYYIDDEPAYALVIMTQDLALDSSGNDNQFFGLLNLRLNRWFQTKHQLIN